YGIPVELWPELRSPGDIIGELTSEAASEIGLKKGIPVVLGGGDQQCSALGLGVINNGDSKVTTGTGTFVDLVVEGPVKQVGDIPIFSLPHVIKGKWVIEGTMPGTGTMFQTYARNFSQLQIEQCKDKDISVYDILTEEAKQAPPGSNGLLFIPLYMFRKGTIHGIGWHHTRAHFSRAIMESAALSAQMYLQMLEAMGGVKVDVIKSDGGAMNSSLWAQIMADILGKKIMVPENKDGAALGAAILGFYGLKKYSTIESSIEKMVRFDSEFVPDKANGKIYKKLIRVFMPEVLRINEAKRITKDL
ncbi:MAG: FGGY-family carbohydrate kinase, partial [Promethearchaeota archaeon]